MLQNPELEKIIGQNQLTLPCEELNWSMKYIQFDRQDHSDGKLQPVFFGSADNFIENC
jgi:peptide chain release factor 3